MYRIVAGERRWRAARMAGLFEVPAVIRELSESEAAEAALVENLQREDLNAVEEAKGFRQLIDKYSLTQEQVADAVGKSRPAVTNALRLLSLPDEVVKLVETGALSAGHAKAVLSADEGKRTALAKRSLRRGFPYGKRKNLLPKRKKHRNPPPRPSQKTVGIRKWRSP
jgi:ParB family chromosome partitioning protein